MFFEYFRNTIRCFGTFKDIFKQSRVSKRIEKESDALSQQLEFIDKKHSNATKLKKF